MKASGILKMAAVLSTGRRMTKGLVAAASLLATASLVQATPQESTIFLNVVSNGGFNDPVNDVRTSNFVGGYSPKAIRVSGTLQKDHIGTFRSESRFYVIPPSGPGFELQLALQTTWGPDLSGITADTNDLVLPIPVPIADAAGTWTFRSYESFDDGGVGLPDATWTTITFTLDDARPNGLIPLTAARGVYTEAEPNDNTFPNNSTTTAVVTTPTGATSPNGGANLVPSMIVGQSVTGISTGSSLTVPGLATGDNYQLRLAPDMTPGIYRYQLDLTSGIVGHTATLRAFAQTNRSVVQGPGSILSGSDSSLQSHTLVGMTRRNQWYGFGKGEDVYYRVAGSGTTIGPYASTLSRTIVTPIVIADTLAAGPVSIGRAAGNTTTVSMLLYDSNFNPIANRHSATTPLVRTLAPGTYYLAVSNVTTANSRPSDADSTSLTNLVAVGPDAVINSSATLVTNLNMTVSTAAGTASSTGATKANPFDVAWFTFTLADLGPAGACCVGLNCTQTVQPLCGGTFTAGALCSTFVPGAFAEGFDDITTLPSSGWHLQNNSQPVGTTGWFQGNPVVFPAHTGATNSYIGANFNNTTGTNTISNWLLLPAMTLENGMTLSFYTRTATGSTFPDRLQVRMSTNGSSTDVGATNTSVGDFTTLLLDINPTYTVGGYPQTWTQFLVTVSGLSGPTSGRLAFRYFVENGGPSGANSNYIGIDTVGIGAVDLHCEPTVPTCPADIAPPGGNGTVNIDDLFLVINSWGACPAPCPPRCAADIAPIPNGNCTVNIDDLFAVINAWGPCPPPDGK